MYLKYLSVGVLYGLWYIYEYMYTVNGEWYAMVYEAEALVWWFR